MTGHKYGLIFVRDIMYSNDIIAALTISAKYGDGMNVILIRFYVTEWFARLLIVKFVDKTSFILMISNYINYNIKVFSLTKRERERKEKDERYRILESLL